MSWWRGEGRRARDRWWRGRLGGGGDEELVIPFPVPQQLQLVSRLLVLLPVARRCPSITGEVVFGLAMMQLGQRRSWVLLKLDNPEQQGWLCHAFNGGDGGGSYRLLRWSRLVTVGDRSQ
jgi:hypothetical protein